MSALVVYESAWGNTRVIAESVAAGLVEQLGREAVQVVDVQEAPPLQDVHADLLVVGAPTHAFGLSRSSTRDEAHRRGGTSLTTGVREWLEGGGCVALGVAAFDTHVRHPNLPGSASHAAARKLRKLGCRLIVDPESFWVQDYAGPLLAGETDRATAWGVEVAGRLVSADRGA